MAAGAPVLASDLDAFRRVLDDGRVGALFPTGDTAALSTALLELLGRPRPARGRCRAPPRPGCGGTTGRRSADELVAVYETVAAGAGAVGEDVPRPWRDRLRRATETSGGVGGRP